MMTTYNGKNIDNDVVERILSMLLDPESLMRFKCVSKSWYALITNPMFIAKHLSNSFNNNINSTTSVLVKNLVKKDINNSESEIEEEVLSFLNFYNDIDVDDDDDSGVNKHSILCNVEQFHNPLCVTDLNTTEGSLIVIGHCNGIICLAHSSSGIVILCNPAIQEFKLVSSPPYLVDSKVDNLTREFVYAMGFGYDVIFNEYKVINIGFSEEEHCDDRFVICHPPKIAVHTLGTDCWREIKDGCLETETNVLWPEQFQIYFNQMCYWFGREQHKELCGVDFFNHEFIRTIIIMFDTCNELFHYILLPDSYYCGGYTFTSFQLLVWNESIAFFGYQGLEESFGMWVMDDEFDGIKGAWTKHIDFKLDECPLVFLKSEEILTSDGNTYNVATKKWIHLPIRYPLHQKILYGPRATLYVKSIVTVLRNNSVKNSRDNSSSNELVFDIFNHYSLFNHHSIMKRKNHSYSIWVIPSNDACFRIKKVMEGLRAKFGGPKIEPHITILCSICMTNDEVVNKFSSLKSLSWIIGDQPKVNLVVTRNFYYQCVSLELSSKLVERCSSAFNIYADRRLHLSLFYGHLKEEERKKAKEIVNFLDESICNMTFTLNRIALYKIDYNDISLKSWEKIAEFPLQHGGLINDSPIWCIGNM